MPIIESRLRLGTLTLGGTAFATQATNVRLVPSTEEDGDPLETLSGDEILPDEQTSWALAITAVQDFDEATGFVNYAMQNAGDVVAFVWAPTGATGPSYAGNVKVRPVEIGGDVNARLTTEAEWPIEGVPTPTYPV